MSFRLIWVLMLLISVAKAADPDFVRLNQVQYIGSHNSYHAGFGPSEAELWKKTQPEQFASLDYRHPDLAQQFDDGVRQIELDVYADAKGGRYSHPAIDKLVAEAGLPPDPPFADAAIMQKPGFKVMHIQDVDQRSNCQPLKACLEQVREWSKQHPQHLPLFVLLETKDDPLQVKFTSVMPEPFNTATLNALDAEIRSVFPRKQYITPDDVRGRYRTLNRAILKRGWPGLDASRGKILFLLDQRKVTAAYLKGHSALRGRVMFTNSTPGEPDAAFIERNDGPASEITRLVRERYLVRTRTDADLKEPRANDIRRRGSMMGSGAQLLSTDFPRNEPADTGYVVQFPSGRNARCTPVISITACRFGDLHD